MSVRLQDLLPSGWLDVFDPQYPRIGLGLDIATTTGGKSNPSALAITQEVGLMRMVRSVVRFKTDDPDVTTGLIELAHAGLRSRGLNARRLCIDATNERFFAVQLKRKLAGKLPVELIISSEKTTYMGEEMLWKVYLGNLLINTADDGYLGIPPLDWLKNDLRQVVRDRGTFTAEVTEDGGHADCFDGIKLSLHALKAKGGRGDVKAAGPGTLGRGVAPGRKVLNPYAAKFERRGRGRLVS
ncbi:MAG TPA: hypothetical protein VK163_08840 [Opitutaceae bacterium]|nr:hypothetical protein [Opitutaceae bacterium]